MSGDLAQDAVLREQRDDDELREQPGLHAFHHAPGEAAGLRLTELHRPHQPEPAHFANDVVRLDERPRQLEQAARPSCADRSTSSRVVELAQRREAGGHRQVVRRERRAVADRVLERVEDAVVHVPRHQQRADGDVAARERLRDGDEVRLEPPVLEGEQLPRAAEAGLHLVDGEERPVAAAELLRAFEIAGRRQVDALALDRLDEEERDVLAAQLALERIEVAERNLREPRQQRAEALDEVRIAVRRERAQREPVEMRVRSRARVRAPSPRGRA